ncbi:hypothetical protein BCS98_18015 [Vibrio breoganii]|uniref:hypothetical protein n=1 Tax=Vibrio breoganii TaxID=553239 RepID=UPI000C81AD2F|nr:hypothetical protein [Vibrio breoganii]PMO87648.1 hypothetical protein BCS98_18015 [Vibrio breoganii]
MFKQVIALGLLPLLVACNSSDSNTNGGNDNGGDGGSIIVPGEPGIDIDGPDNGGDGEDGTGGDITPPDPDEDVFNPTYKKAADYFHVDYQKIEDICDTDYSEFLSTGTNYSLTCDWVENKNEFVIRYTEFSNDLENQSGEHTTLSLRFDEQYSNTQEFSIDALLYHPMTEGVSEVTSFAFEITDNPFDWTTAISYPFSFEVLSSGMDLLIMSNSNANPTLVNISQLYESESKRFRVISNAQLESGETSIYDNFSNEKLFYFVYQAFRYK